MNEQVKKAIMAFAEGVECVDEWQHDQLMNEAEAFCEAHKDGLLDE